MPVFNGEAYLRKALDSLASQTRRPDRVIVIDDASSDRSVEIAVEAGAECLSLECNRGPSHARNRGIAEASDCDAVLFLDADDWLEKNHLERLETLLLDCPECAVAFSGVRCLEQSPSGVWREVDVEVPAFEHGSPLRLAEALFYRNRIPQSGTLARRQPILDVGGYDEAARFSEDYHLWTRLALDHPFVCSGHVGVNYRVHPGQATSDQTRLQKGLCRTRDDIWRILQEGGRTEYLESASRAFGKAWAADLKEAIRVRSRSGFRVLVASPPPETGKFTLLAYRALAGPLWTPLMGLQWAADTITNRRRS